MNFSWPPLYKSRQSMKGKFPIMGLNRWDRQDRYSHMIILYDSYRCKHISPDFQTGEACFSIDCSSTRVFSRESFRRRNAASCHESTAPSNFTLALPWLPWAPVQWVSWAPVWWVSSTAVWRDPLAASFFPAPVSETTLLLFPRQRNQKQTN